MAPKLTLNEVNNLNSDDFIKIFGSIVEHYPAVAAGIAQNRPFHSITDIVQAANNYLNDVQEDEKETILKLHPDLGGRLAKLKMLSSESTEEQKSAGLDKISAEQQNKLTTFNGQYVTKFGFPFVICARANNIETILQSIENRLKHDGDRELQTGIEEVKKICKLRICEIVD